MPEPKREPNSLAQLLRCNTTEHSDGCCSYQIDAALTDHDLAHLADWASEVKDHTPNQNWKRAYALIREGADMLLRRRAMSRVQEDTPYELEVKHEKLSCGCEDDCKGHSEQEAVVRHA